MGFGRTTAVLLAGALLYDSASGANAKAKDLDPDLAAIQDHIASFDAPNGYYRTTYRVTEIEYWTHIPKWMRDDSSHRKVTRVLDIGCGYGTLLILAVKIYGAQGYCLDSAPYIAKVAEADGIKFVQSNIELDPVPFAERFDVILMTEVLEHFNFNPVPTLKKIRDSLATGGRFYLSTPDARTWGRVGKYYKRLADIPDPPQTPAKLAPKVPPPEIMDEHIWVYDRPELIRVFKEAGFRVEKLDISNPDGASHFNVVLLRE
jgi:SAM-dependent methyltransferase